VEVEGEGIGTIRHIWNEGVDRMVSERLDFLDSENMTWILSIIGDRPRGITAYVAIGRLQPLGSDCCRVDYRCYVTTPTGMEKRIEEILRYTWLQMFEGLEQAARRPSIAGRAHAPEKLP